MVWLHVISDCLIHSCITAFPFVLVYFIRKQRDLPLNNRIFWMFGTFILACGFHLFVPGILSGRACWL
jgi:hypothetical protein